MNSELYSASASNINRTVLQGAPHRPVAAMSAADSGNAPRDGKESQAGTPRETLVELQPRPLAGVLISASADGMGEIFPIYIGRNLIGNSPDADVYLSESTVSPGHAVILVRMVDDPSMGRPRMQVSFTDYDSEYGSVVDGSVVGYDRVPLRGGSRISIGRGYTFMLYIFDSSIPGLGQNPMFAPTERRRLDPPADNFRQPGISGQSANSDNAHSGEVYPNSVGAEDEFAFYGRSVKPALSHSRNATVDNQTGLYSQSPDATSRRTVLNPAEPDNSPRPERPESNSTVY